MAIYTNIIHAYGVLLPRAVFVSHAFDALLDDLCVIECEDGTVEVYDAPDNKEKLIGRVAISYDNYEPSDVFVYLADTATLLLSQRTGKSGGVGSVCGDIKKRPITCVEEHLMFQFSDLVDEENDEIDSEEGSMYPRWQVFTWHN
jgi:hypothetical protein